MSSSSAFLRRALALFLTLTCAAAWPQTPALSARSWLLLDAASGTTLASYEPTLRLEPASLAKLMTAYVVFLAIAEKRIGLEDRVTVSRTAFAAPGRAGSRMFIEPGRPVTVQELLRGLIVVSGNDAAVALAEHVSGSQSAFVDRMNAEAQRLRLNDTHFANPTGLSDPQQYSSARDLARLALRLQSDFPQYAPLFREREFAYNGITQANRNSLLWTDPTVDGLKTGQLEASGYSIVATASRPRGSGSSAFERRLVAAVLGAPSDAVRAQEALRLLNYGYTAYDTILVHRARSVLARAEVWKGDRSEVPIGPENDVYITLQTPQLQRLGERGLKSTIERPDPLLAPLTQGETVGRLKITADQETVADAPVVALEAVAPAGLFGRAYDAVRLWWRRRN
ncbi:MAG TPA: D-alanyl-D-alanine carboxypeptidase family protein [Burkholderiaceae bacterium]|nr:D-alanyl-D-alanine carboxypeptidase family protein [Burkholderiaceae bacterium]